MSRNRQSNVRGPTSALTEFLREKNIYVANTNRFRRRDEHQLIVEGAFDGNLTALAETEASATATAATSAGAGASAGASGVAGPSTSTSAVPAVTFDVEAGPSTRKTRGRASRSVKREASPEVVRAGKAKKAKKAKKGLSLNFDEDDDDEYISKTEDEATDAETGALSGNVTADEDGDDQAAEEDSIWARISRGEVSNVSLKQISSGALDHCPGCEKRFTITQYTIHTASGGLCHKCAPQYTVHMASGAKTARAGPSRVNGNGNGNGKGKVSVILPDVPEARPRGAKPQPKKITIVKPQFKKALPSLQAMCINIISQYIEDVEALGGIGQESIDALSKSICKNRRLNPQTVQLFLEADTQTLALYDASNLDGESLSTIPTFSPSLHTINLQLCGQLNNAALDDWTSKLHHLRSIQLYGPYLVRVDAWHRLFERIGERLEVFKIRESPRLDIDCIKKMVEMCPNVKELGLAQVGKLDGAALKPLAAYKNLRYLDVSDPGVTAPGIPPESLQDDDIIELLSHIGGSLEYLDLSGNADLTDRVALEGLLPYCKSLKTLRLERCEYISGDALTIVFDAWSAFGNIAQLEHLSLQRCITVEDSTLVASLQHSGSALRTLALNGCDQLSSASLKRIAETPPSQSPDDKGAEIFAADSTYSHPCPCPNLTYLDVSFVRATDDDVIMSLVKNVPQLDTIMVFGDHKISDFVAGGTAKVKIVGLEKVPLIGKNTVSEGY